MAWIQSLLSIVVERGADELRISAGESPKMFRAGTERHLSIPPMSDSNVRELLGDALSPDVWAALERGEQPSAPFDAGSLGVFSVTFSRGGAGIRAVFRRGQAAASTGTPGTERGAEPRVIAASMPPSASPLKEAAALASAPNLEMLVAHAAALGASDVHFADGEPPLARVDGRLRRIAAAPVDVAALLDLSDSERSSIATNGSADRGLDVATAGRLRIHVYGAAGRLAATVRLLPPEAPALAELQLPMPLDDLVELPNGLVLVVGAAGSGKSTTLAALAREALHRRSVVLLTLEDPIEYSLPTTTNSVVRRRQIGRDVPDFSSGLRDALRADPDVLLIGEMRDPETIALALTAAETGHLVLASLHSGSAASSVERIVDAYPRERQNQIRTQLADCLRAVVGQRLVPKARGGGRVPVMEVLRVNHAVANMIREGRTPQITSALQSGRREGMLSLERCLVDRVAAGDISLEEARSAANDRASFEAYLAN